MSVPKHTLSFLFGLTAALRYVLYSHEENSPETDLAVEFLIRESSGELSRQQALARLRYVLPWNLRAWMTAGTPEEQPLEDRLRLLSLCTEVLYLRGDIRQIEAILFAGLLVELDLPFSYGDAAETAALDSLANRRSDWIRFRAGHPNWEVTPWWLLTQCELYEPALKVYPEGSAQWHLARDRFAELWGDEVDRRSVFFALSTLPQWRELGRPHAFEYRNWVYEARVSLLRDAVDIVLVEPKVTRRKLKRLGEFADRLDLPEAAVQEVLDARAAERDPASG